MEANMQIALEAINKWLYFGWNFISEPYEWRDFGDTIRNEVVPVFLKEVRWTCNFSHIYDKWKKATASGDSDTYLVRFYAELDNWNRRPLLEWVMKNYNDERKLI